MTMKVSGIIRNILLSKDLRKVSLSSGVINVIIPGVLIMELLNSILHLRRIEMVFFWKMKFLLGLLRTNWIAKTVLLLLILVSSNSKATN